METRYIISLVVFCVSSSLMLKIYNNIDKSAVPSIPSPTRDFSRYGEVAGKERAARTDDFCADSQTRTATKPVNVTLWSKRKIKERPRLYFSDRHKFVVCATPKCGTTQWRILILILEGIIDAHSADTYRGRRAWILAWEKRLLWNVFDIGTAHGKNESEYRLRKYFKIMTVREPLERLVSAYKSKLETKNGRSEFVAMSKKIHEQYGNGTGEMATFSEFIKMILDTKSPEKLNAHWKPYTNLCKPCNIKYDYILKMETIYDDVTYVTGKLGIERNRFFNDSSGAALQSKWKTEYHEYYQQLTPAQRKAIYNYYKSQYDAFGYGFPDFI